VPDTFFSLFDGIKHGNRSFLPGRARKPSRHPRPNRRNGEKKVSGTLLTANFEGTTAPESAVKRYLTPFSRLGPACRMGCSRPKHHNTNSAGRFSGLRLLTVAQAAFPRLVRSGHRVPYNLADYSGGPATDLHRFPVYPPREKATKRCQVPFNGKL